MYKNKLLEYLLINLYKRNSNKFKEAEKSYTLLLFITINKNKFNIYLNL